MKRYIYHYSGMLGRDGKTVLHGVINLDTKIDSMEIYNKTLELVLGSIKKEVSKYSNFTTHDFIVTSLSYLHSAKETEE